MLQRAERRVQSPERQEKKTIKKNSKHRILCINKLTYVINKCGLMILIDLSLGGNYLCNNNFLLVLNF